MANLRVRNLPDDVHVAPQQRAKCEGRSLQQCVTRELTRIAQRPSLPDVGDRIERHTGGTAGLAQAVEDRSLRCRLRCACRSTGLRAANRRSPPCERAWPAVQDEASELTRVWRFKGSMTVGRQSSLHRYGSRQRALLTRRR
ncbi:MAG: FitA-like ribbon-helix-helix domain-containing protein [Solirubrobacteraceae bacterium]